MDRMEHQAKRGRFSYYRRSRQQGELDGFHQSYLRNQHHPMSHDLYHGNGFGSRFQPHQNPRMHHEHHQSPHQSNNKRSYQEMDEQEFNTRRTRASNYIHDQTPRRDGLLNRIPPTAQYPEIAHFTADSYRNGDDSRDVWTSTRTTVGTLPYPAEGVEVMYTKDPADADSWLKSKIIDSSVKAIGLDIEWKPQFIAKKMGGTENKTAVIQLAVEESCLVLHICHMRLLPTFLSVVLSDREVIKVGSGIKGDVVKLIRDTGMLCDGRVDTQDYAKAVGIHNHVGLKNLSRQVLKIDMNKPKSVSTSNWELFPLKKMQINYAAIDAWISLKLYQNLKEKLEMKNEGTTNPRVVQVQYDKPGPEKSVGLHQTFQAECLKCGNSFKNNNKLSKHKKKCTAVKQTSNFEIATSSTMPHEKESARTICDY